MKVYKMPWKQMREKDNPKSEVVTLESVVLVLKAYSIFREDFEYITPKEEEDAEITWKTRNRLSSIFEVYPDIDSYNNRAIPISVTRDTNLLKEGETDYENILWEKLKNKKDDLQDFSKGTIETV